MANEAVLHIELSRPVGFTVADGTAITKGAILQLNDPVTAIAATTDNPLVAGIAAVDKIASSGITSLGVHRAGRFKGTASGTVNVGDPLTFFSDNLIGALDMTGQTISGQRCLGVSLETATDGQTFFFELNPQQVWPSI